MIGTRLAHYEITGHLGTGGMGEVYQATDMKLDRSVAIKLLPASHTDDQQHLKRFANEARVLASLNHPNIAAIYGVEESGGRTFLVMELVPGVTLADRIRRGPIVLDEALPLARQIAEGLEAAHEKGIVHRDLKPANIKITPQGQLKVLDFGLAKAFAPGTGDAGLTSLPTRSMSRIGDDVIVGTPAYMSPEQARGHETDRATDIWAFGCVLYEMLRGRAAFEGETVGEILGGIFRAEPEWDKLSHTTPPGVLALLKRCLQKDRARRLRDIADARFQIEEALSESTSPAAPIPAGKGRPRPAWSALTLALAAGLAWSLVYRSGAPPVVPEMRLEVSTPGGSLSGFSISPDGRRLVYVATVGGRNQLWLRPLGSEEAHPLAGTENAAFPFWSPDSRSVGFFSSGQVKRIDIDGEIVQNLAEAPFNTRGGAWSLDGTILFTHSSTEPLFRVSATGGKAVAATAVQAPHIGHRYPCFLPDGRHFLFFAYGPTESQGIYVGSLDSTDSKRLLDSDSAAVFAAPDYVLFSRRGAVLAQRVDLKTLQPIGDPEPLARRAVGNSGTVADIALSAASAAHVVAYRATAGQVQTRWVDRQGRQLSLLGGVDDAQPVSLQLSRDGRTAALSRMVDGNNDIWLMETTREVLHRFTSDPGREYNAVFSPDGTRIVFGSTRNGVLDLYEKPVGGGAELLLWKSDESKNATDWSADGNWLLFSSQSPKTSVDLWALSMKGKKKTTVIAQTPAAESDAQFAPDGRWIAYTSNESGRDEVYIQPFPGPGPRQQISTGGASLPRWRSDGKELFYIGTRDQLFSASIKDGAVQGAAVALFSLSAGATFAPASEGQRFLVRENTRDAPPITVLLNWLPRAR